MIEAGMTIWSFDAKLGASKYSENTMSKCACYRSLAELPTDARIKWGPGARFTKRYNKFYLKIIVTFL